MHGSTGAGRGALDRAVRRGVLLLGVLWLVRRRRSAAPARSAASVADPSGSPAPRLPVHVPLPADRQAHDGRTGTRRQLVFLEGGPGDGGRVALGWDADRHRVSDADKGTCLYVDSGRTRPDALGAPARVFVPQ